MKKKLEAELISIAHRILQGIDKSSIVQLQEEAREIYEKLTILSFSESHFAGPQPTIGQVRAALDEDTSNTSTASDELKEVRKKIEEIIAPEPSNITDVTEDEPIVASPVTPVLDDKNNPEETSNVDDKPELVIEEINARVTTEDLFVPAQVSEKNTSFSGKELDTNIVEVAAVDKSLFNTDNEDKPKSLNDQLRKDIHIGLNDRLAFIKYLFDGSTADYNRVLSQLNTLRTKEEAQDFINTMIKPDYNWEGKEEYEERFMDIVRHKFED